MFSVSFCAKHHLLGRYLIPWDANGAKCLGQQGHPSLGFLPLLQHQLAVIITFCSPPFYQTQASKAGKWCAIYSFLTQRLERWSETQEPRDILYIRSVRTVVSAAVFYSRERGLGHRRIIDNLRPLISSHSNDYFHLSSLFPYETRWNVSLHDLIRILVHIGDIFL